MMAAFALAVGVIGGLITSIAYIGLSEGVSAPAQVVSASLPATSVNLFVNGSAGSLSIPSDYKQTISWTTSGVSNCEGRAFSSPTMSQWFGYVDTSGSKVIENATGTQVYTLSCKTPSGGTLSNSVAVVAKPWVDMKIDNVSVGSVSIAPKATTTISWTTSSDTKDCQASLTFATTSYPQIVWGGGFPKTGSKVLNRLESTQGFILRCKTWTGQNSAAVSTINIVPKTVAPIAGSSTLTIFSDINTPPTQNIYVNPLDGAKLAKIGSVNLKNELGDSIVTRVTVDVNTTGTMPLVVYLYDSAGTLFGSTAGGSSQVVFQGLSIPIGKDVTKTLRFMVDMPANTVTGTSMSIGKNVSVAYTMPNGSLGIANASNLDVKTQYFFPVAAQFTLVSATASSGGTNQYGSTTAPSATFVFKVKGNGGSLVPFSTASTTVKFSTSTLATATTHGISTNVMIDGNPSVLSEGVEYTVNVTGLLTPSIPRLGTLPGGPSTVTFYLTNMRWTSTNGVVANQTWGLEDYKTNSITVIR